MIESIELRIRPTQRYEPLFGRPPLWTLGMELRVNGLETLHTSQLLPDPQLHSRLEQALQYSCQAFLRQVQSRLMVEDDPFDRELQYRYPCGCVSHFDDLVGLVVTRCARHGR